MEFVLLCVVFITCKYANRVISLRNRGVWGVHFRIGRHVRVMLSNVPEPERCAVNISTQAADIFLKAI